MKYKYKYHLAIITGSTDGTNHKVVEADGYNFIENYIRFYEETGGGGMYGETLGLYPQNRTIVEKIEFNQ
jgi:hypothetical protein